MEEPSQYVEDDKEVRRSQTTPSLADLMRIGLERGLITPQLHYK